MKTSSPLFHFLTFSLSYFRTFTLSHFLAYSLTLLAITSSASALTSKVLLTDGGTPELRVKISEHLTSIVNILESRHWDGVAGYFTADGLASLRELASQTHPRNVNPLYETRLLELPAGGWEVRDIKVLIDTRGARSNPYQFLVFTLTPDGLASDVRFALEQTQYQDVLKKGELLQDFAARQQILQFLEIFRTAYNRKDLDFLERVYSEDALIIVGRVLKPKPDAPDMLEKSRLTRDRIEFIKLSKQEYLTNLKRCFAANEFIKVAFDSVELCRHPRLPQVYGVALFQDWRSPTYSDQGYLFLMMDFRNSSQTEIHVRSWQPERFPDGSVVGLGDFELVE
jgi:hypothetical protein